MKYRVNSINKKPNYTYDGYNILTSNKKYHMRTILQLHKIMHNYTDYPSLDKILNHINKEYQFASLDGIRKIIYHLERGYFDEYLEDYTNNKYGISQYLLDFFKKYKFQHKIYNIKNIAWNRIYTDTHCLSYTLDDVIYIKEKLPYYAENNYRRKDIVLDSNIHKNIGLLLYNLYHHNFDPWIELYQSPAYKYKNHKRKVKPHNCKDLSIIGISQEWFIYNNHNLTQYTIKDIIKLKKELSNYKDYPTNKSLGTLINIRNKDNIEKIIWNTESGVYDKWIDLYYTETPSCELKETYYNQLDSRLKNIKPYEITGTIKDNLPLKILYNYKPYETYYQYNSSKGKTLIGTFNKNDVRKLYHAYENMETDKFSDYYHLVPHLSRDVVKRILATFLVDGFKEYI